MERREWKCIEKKESEWNGRDTVFVFDTFVVNATNSLFMKVLYWPITGTMDQTKNQSDDDDDHQVWLNKVPLVDSLAQLTSIAKYISTKWIALNDESMRAGENSDFIWLKKQKVNSWKKIMGLHVEFVSFFFVTNQRCIWIVWIKWIPCALKDKLQFACKSFYNGFPSMWINGYRNQMMKMEQTEFGFCFKATEKVKRKIHKSNIGSKNQKKTCEKSTISRRNIKIFVEINSFFVNV